MVDRFVFIVILLLSSFSSWYFSLKSDSKFVQVSQTLLSILADFNSAVV